MDSQSGRKIVTKRHRRHTTTPYDRVPASSQPAPKSPSWLTRIIFPATHMIASGASKILSSVFDSDDSSSSLSSSDSGHASENDANNDNHDNTGIIYTLNEDPGTASEAMKIISTEPQLNGEKSYAKHLEQLLMEGKFSSQECDRFIEIIKSRVVDSDLGGENNASFKNADGIWGEYTDNLCSKAVMEAKKWLQQKKVESSPISNMADGASGLNSSQQIGNEVSSPADVAKQYVKSRSPWSSPSAEHFEMRTPAKMAGLFREDTSMAVGHESTFKKRSSLASGSWNIQEEIRKVRAKASEDMLNYSPSMRNALSLSSPDWGANLSVFRREDEGKALNSTYASALLERYCPKTHGECDASDLSPPLPDLSKENLDSHSIHSKDPLVDALRKSDGTQDVNALPTSQATLPTEVDAGENDRKLVKQNVNGVTKEAMRVEDGCEFLSEASVEVPIMDEMDAMAKLGGKVDGTSAKAEEKKPARSRVRGRGRIKGSAR